MKVVIFLFIALFMFPLTAKASDCVFVKYRGSVPLESFQCNEITDSSFIRRVCYDKPSQYMLINLNGTYYHYCSIDVETVDSLLGAESKGRFYNGFIKGKASFDCRVNPQAEFQSKCN